MYHRSALSPILSIPARAAVAPIVITLALLAASGCGGDSDASAAEPREPAAGESEPSALTALVDPLRDDWESEARSSRAGERLGELATWLATPGAPAEALAPLLAPGARSAGLLPERSASASLPGGLRAVSSADRAGSGERPLAAALGALAKSFHERATASTRVKFKVIGVEGGAETFSTHVRVEAAGARAAGPWQQVAEWRVEWAAASGKDAPRMRAVLLESFSETSAPGRLFSDVTGGVLPLDAPWYDELRLGGEWWYGRIDALGELNLMGHNGIAVGDFDGDGLEDLYVALGTGLPNKLLRQLPDGTVRDVAEQAGVAWLDDTKGVLFADTDDDGDQDLLMALGPTIVLAKNDGRGGFERFVSMRAPTGAAFYSLSAADYDLDGDLDIYGVRYVEVAYGVSVPLPFHDADNGPSNHLMRNDGDDRFADVTVTVGLDVNNRRFSLAGVWEDYDDDGDPDLYVANDFGRNNLYRNDGGRFVDVAAGAGVEDQAAGMGVAFSDVDLDGDFDLHVTNMFSSAGSRVAYQSRFKADASEAEREQIRRFSSGNSLFANQGDGTFREIGEEAGIRMGRWGWGARFADLNNDGLEDLVVPNGFLTGALEDDL